MEILKSKISEFPNYFFIKFSKNYYSPVKQINSEKNHNYSSSNFLKSNLKIKNLFLFSKNIETHTLLEHKNDFHDIINSKVKPYINIEHKNVKNWISSYKNKPKSKYNQRNLDKLRFSYFPNKEKINNNIIFSIKK